ncbi:MAG: hypothetical protein AAFQ66_01000 [Pseudomonadota bacterium]
MASGQYAGDAGVNPLHWAARAGPWVLVAGLVVGLGSPTAAAAMRPWIPHLVVVLLFLAALRLEPTALATARQGWGRAVSTVLVLQCALPLGVLAIGWLAGLIGSDGLLALVVMLSASAISSSPNMCLMLGRPPEPAIRLLILGTVLLPITVVPVFLALPRLGGVGPVLTAAAILAATILAATAAAQGIRRFVWRDISASQRASLDGLSAIMLAIFVVGLMQAAADVLAAAPLRMLGWLGLALAANFGLQLCTWAVVGRHWPPDQAIATSLAAGNRNMALFLVSLPADVLEPILIFIGCYQIPMYITPLVMRRLWSAS